MESLCILQEIKARKLNISLVHTSYFMENDKSNQSAFPLQQIIL